MTLAVLSRRGLIKASLILAASTALSTTRLMAQEKTRLVVAADSEPKNLNPAVVASNGVFFLSSKVIEPLAEASYDGENGLAPRLALSWEGADDGLSITFKLRKGVTWHDGKPFTSEDVAFSALEVWKPLQNLGRSVFANLEAVDTPDAHTAVFKFGKPTPIQLIRNALPAVTAVLPKHVFAGTDLKAAPTIDKLIGTGPFKFTEYKPGEYYLLSKNEAYWEKGEPKVDEIVFRVLPDRAGAGAALEAEEIHLAAFSAVPLADLDRISKVPGIKVISKGYEALTYQLVVETNHRRKELADLKVRQAIAHAIDRDFVVDTIFLGYAAASTGPVPKNAPEFYTGDVPTYDFSVDKANALLDEAGYKRRDDGTRFHGVEFRLPDTPPIGLGYIQPPEGPIVEADVVRASETVGEDGLITSGQIDFGPSGQSLAVAPLAFGPLRLVAPDGRATSFPRAMCRVTADDGRPGVAWIEWNRNRSAGL